MKSSWRAAEGTGSVRSPALIKLPKVIRITVTTENVPGVRELVVDGRTGVLIERENVVALSDAIIRLAGDARLRTQLGQAGRKRICEEFPIEATVATHEKLYEEVVGS